MQFHTCSAMNKLTSQLRHTIIYMKRFVFLHSPKLDGSSKCWACAFGNCPKTTFCLMIGDDMLEIHILYKD